MLDFKAILVKRENKYKLFFYDTKTIMEGTNKFKLLKCCQDEIMAEIKRRGDLFNPSYEKPQEVLKRVGYNLQKGDQIAVYEFKIEFEYRTYKFARFDFDPIETMVVE
jgi:hypothetical protein